MTSSTRAPSAAHANALGRLAIGMTLAVPTLEHVAERGKDRVGHADLAGEGVADVALRLRVHQRYRPVGQQRCETSHSLGRRRPFPDATRDRADQPGRLISVDEGHDSAASPRNARPPPRSCEGVSGNLHFDNSAHASIAVVNDLMNGAFVSEYADRPRPRTAPAARNFGQRDGQRAADTRPTLMSMIGFAGSPATAVDPTCSMREPRR